MDHVLPLSKGGKTQWDNMVTACQKCNFYKSDRTDIKPIYKPYRPGYWELVRKRKQFGFEIKHPSWFNFIE